MRFIKLGGGVPLKQFKRLYIHAFPRRERAPFRALYRAQQRGKEELFLLEKDGGFCGLAAVAVKDDLALLLFFAIAEDKRGGGLGGEAIEALKKRYADKRLFLEIEATDVPAANAAERQRRKRFYLRHGLKEMPFTVLLCGLEMEILTGGQEVTYRDYRRVYASLVKKPSAFISFARKK